MFAIGDGAWPGVSKTIEEMGELHQILGKLLGSRGDTNHWSGDLREKLIEEIADVRAAIYFLMQYNFTSEEKLTIYARTNKKVNKFVEWHEADLLQDLSSEEV